MGPDSTQRTESGGVAMRARKRAPVATPGVITGHRSRFVVANARHISIGTALAQSPNVSNEVKLRVRVTVMTTMLFAGLAGGGCSTGWAFHEAEPCPPGIAGESLQCS
jgi:hypothetical protein